MNSNIESLKRKFYGTFIRYKHIFLRDKYVSFLTVVELNLEEPYEFKKKIKIKTSIIFILRYEYYIYHFSSNEPFNPTISGA